MFNRNICLGSAVHPYSAQTAALAQQVVDVKADVSIVRKLKMRLISTILYCFGVGLLLGGAGNLRADWVNLTGAETAPNIAELYVFDDHVKVVLEVSYADIKTFEPLIPDSWLTNLSINRASAEERLRQFAGHTFQVITDTGKKLSAELQVVERRMRTDRQSLFAGMINPFTRQRVPEAPADKRVLYAELIYPFEGEPAQLTFVPPRDEEGRSQVTIGFIAYHKSVPIIDFRYLGAPAQLKLDWDDPWYTKFDNPNLKRHHKSALMSYLYVEPYEVRHELLVRVKDMANWMDLGLKGKQYIEMDELAALKQRIGEFLLEKNPVRIDAVSYKPILDRTNYIKVGLSGIQLLEKPERLEINTAIIGVIITFITDGLPSQVTMEWQLFTDRINRVPATAIDPAGPLATYLMSDDNLHTWTNYLKNYTLPTVAQVRVAEAGSRWQIPIISLVLLVVLAATLYSFRGRRLNGQSVRLHLGAMGLLMAGTVLAYPYAPLTLSRPALLIADMDHDEAEATLQSLLRNVYRAFDFRDEEDVYDKLALSVSGDLLADIYLQNRKSFAVQKAGGAQAKVTDVEILQVAAQRLDEKPLAYAAKAKWTATGTVGHWGHTHIRKNYYDAIVTIEGIDGQWKITALELLEEKRVDPYKRLATTEQASD
ncbi:MAG: hypothetical protein V7731_20625 [Amphritea sp.]